ncbi:unnamed protein product, partial [marine sediment metagenome]
AFLLYLLLTTASGPLFLWSKEELIIGAIFALIVAAIVRKVFPAKNLRLLNPKRWFLLLAYIIWPFFPAMAKANIDVAYRVITGRINVKKEALEKMPRDYKYVCGKFPDWARRVME